MSGGNNYDIALFEAGEFEIYFFKGDGASEASAYEIGRVEQLTQLVTFVNANNAPYANAGILYKLTENIILTDTWTPIGNVQSRPFRGNFNGNVKIVRGLNITGNSNDVGLFGYINGGSVKNLGVEGKVIDKDEAKDNATYVGLEWSFDGNSDASPWVMGTGDYKLPVFWWQTEAPAAMPVHLE